MDFTLQSVLKLLSNFLNQVKQQQLPYNPSNPRMLRGARVAVEWGGNNNTSRQYVCTVDNFDGSKGLHHVTYDDGDTRWYAVRPGNTADVYLTNNKGGHDGWVQKWDPKFVRKIQDTFDRLKRYPFHVLTHDIHCFTTLYGMLGRRNKDTARAAW